MMKTRKTPIFFYFIICLFFASCRMNTGEAITDPVEKEGISVARYDKLLDEYVRFNSFSALQKMNTEYRQPTKLLIEDVLAIGQVNDDYILHKLRTYYSDTTLLRLIADVEARYPQLDDVEKGLTRGFRELQKELPDIHIPLIYAQISALNESIVLSDSMLGISLDKYMGEDYPLYKRFYYGYQRQTMRPDRIVPDCFVFYLMSQYPFPMGGRRTLLDVILHYGKINYVVQHILDYPSPEDALGYTKTEKQWCHDNSEKVWDFIQRNNHLDATDPMVVRQYIKPAPSKIFFGDEAPSLIGTWLGTKIVASYMKHHKEVGIRQLLEMTDYRTLFESLSSLTPSPVEKGKKKNIPSFLL